MCLELPSQAVKPGLTAGWLHLQQRVREPPCLLSCCLHLPHCLSVCFALSPARPSVRPLVRWPQSRWVVSRHAYPSAGHHDVKALAALGRRVVAGGLDAALAAYAVNEQVRQSQSVGRSECQPIGQLATPANLQCRAVSSCRGGLHAIGIMNTTCPLFWLAVWVGGCLCVCRA